MNFGDITINISKKTKLSGSGKTELSKDENIKRTINHIGITNVKVKQNCFAVAVLTSIKTLTNSEQGSIFLADQTKSADLVDEHGNECQNFEKLQSYLTPKDFDIVILQDKANPRKTIICNTL